MTTLPENWRRVSLGEIAEPVSPSLSGPLPVLTFKGLRSDGSMHLQEEQGGRFAVALPGDVVFTKQGHVGGWVLKKVGLVRSSQVNVATTLQVVRPSSTILAEFLYYWLSSPTTFGAVQKLIGQRNSLSMPALRAIPVVLPPLSDQRRVVARLEPHLSRLDAAAAALHRAESMLVSMEESWLRMQLAPRQAEVSTVAATLVDCRGGWSRAAKHLVPPGEGVPYIKMNNITRRGELDLAELVYVSANAVELDKFGVKSGDVLFNSKNSGDLIGKTALADSRVEGAVLNENIMRLRFDPRVLPSFAALWFLGPTMRSAIRSASSASTNVAAVYQNQLVAMPMWVPSIARQESLVSEYLDLRSATGRLKSQSRRGRERSSIVRGAVMTAAFSGHLSKDMVAVNVDPSDPSRGSQESPFAATTR